MTQNSKWYGKWLDVQADRDRLAVEKARKGRDRVTSYKGIREKVRMGGLVP